MLIAGRGCIAIHEEAIPGNGIARFVGGLHRESAGSQMVHLGTCSESRARVKPKLMSNHRELQYCFCFLPPSSCREALIPVPVSASVCLAAAAANTSTCNLLPSLFAVRLVSSLGNPMATQSDLGLCTAPCTLGELLPMVRFDLPLDCDEAEQAVVHLGGVKCVARSIYGDEDVETTSPPLFTRPHDIECAPTAGVALEPVPAFVLTIQQGASNSAPTATLTGLVQRQWCFPRLFDFRFLQREGNSLPRPADAGSVAFSDAYVKFRGGPVLQDRSDMPDELIQQEHAYEQWCPPRWFMGEFGDFPPARSLCKQRLPLTYK